mgnify:CR=1 FL=1
MLLALVAVLVLLLRPYGAEAKKLRPSAASAGVLLLVCTVLDFLGSNLSGRGFPHYVVTVLPALGSALALIVAVAVVSGPLATVARDSARSLAFVVVVVLILTSLGLLQPTFSTVQSMVSSGLTNPNSTLSTIAGEVERRTDPEEPVYIWGAETRYLAAAERVSSSSITYYYPVTRPIGDPDAAGRKLAADLRTRPPALVLRPPERECPFEAPCNLAALTEAHGFIAENYRLDDVLIDGIQLWVPR